MRASSSASSVLPPSPSALRSRTSLPIQRCPWDSNTVAWWKGDCVSRLPASANCATGVAFYGAAGGTTSGTEEVLATGAASWAAGGGSSGVRSHAVRDAAETSARPPPRRHDGSSWLLDPELHVAFVRRRCRFGKVGVDETIARDVGRYDAETEAATATRPIRLEHRHPSCVDRRISRRSFKRRTRRSRTRPVGSLTLP